MYSMVIYIYNLIVKFDDKVDQDKKSDISSLPISIQQDISKRRYSAAEINAAYARAMSKE